MKSNVHIRQGVPNWLALAMMLLYGIVEKGEAEKKAEEKALKKKAPKTPRE